MTLNVVDKIAKEVGVSPITVTRALNGVTVYRRLTYAKRAERIRALAERLGYRANAAARAMSTGRFNAIGYLHSAIPHRSHVNSALLHGIYEELARHNLHMTSAMLPDEQLTDDQRMPKLLRELTADGLLIDYLSSIPERMTQLIDKNHVPSIWINSKRESNCVYPDDLAAGRLATEHLIARGHTRISYVALGTSNHYSAADRKAGYRQAMHAAGLTDDVFHPEGLPYEQRLDAALAWIKRDDRPTAVFCYGSNTALPLTAAAMHHGLMPGRDLAVVTTGTEVDRSIGLQMTTVQIPFAEVGRRAVRELQSLIDNPGQERPAVAISPRMLQGVTS
jgi:DNA-binding LacI/PurR family transcriptional regulator